MTMTTFLLDCLVLSAFGFVAVLVVIVGYLLIDWAFRKVELQGQVQSGNVAAGIMSAGIIVGLCIVVGCVAVGVLH